MPKKYVRVKDRRVGLAVKERKRTKTIKNSNQWLSDPRHDLFANYYYNPKQTDTFANAYQSAIKAGYGPNHAKQITSNVLSLQWVKDAKSRMSQFNANHTVKAIEEMAVNAKQDRDRLRALELMGKIQGLFIDRSIQQIDVQFTNGVPRPTEKPQGSVLDGETVTDTSQDTPTDSNR